MINSLEDETDADVSVTPKKEIDPELEKHAYCNQSVWKRILISVAGPFMNVFLGFLMMFVIVLAAGEGAVGTTKIGGFYVQYSAESAEEGGFQSGDYINYIKESREGAEVVRIHSMEQLREIVANSETGIFDVIVLRAEESGAVVEETLIQIPLTVEILERDMRQSLSSAQLAVGDVVKKVNSTSVHTYYELAYEIMNQGHKPISFTVERNGEIIKLDPVQVPTFVDSASNTAFGDLDFKVYGEAKFGFGTVVKHAWYRSVSTVKMVYDSLVGLFSGRYGVEAVSGPVGITKTVSDAARMGWMNVFNLAIVISINLGIMNLLPFPALDGGHLMLYIIEIIRRKPVKKEVEGIINFVGLVILLSLAVIIAIKDIIAL